MGEAAILGATSRVAHKPLSFITAVLAMCETTFMRGGEYLREVSILVMVFVPLDYWKHSEVTPVRIILVVACSAVIFIAGMICEWASYGIKLGKAAWVRSQEEAR